MGVGNRSINSIGNIPSFRFYEHIVLKQLPGLFEDSQTVNGTYTILGLDNETEQQSFLEGLADVSGLDVNGLLESSG